MKFAITPRGIGKAPSWRAVDSADDLLPDEIFYVGDPSGLVVGEGAELRAPNASEALEDAKSEALKRITEARNAALESLTAAWDGDMWDADELTASRIANALCMIREAAALGIQTPPSIVWRTADNKDRTLTIAELTQMGAAVFLAQQAVWAKQAQLKNAAAAANAADKARAIKW